MGLSERPAVRWLLEQAEDRLGIAIEPAAEVHRLRVVEREFGEFAQDAEELALHSLDYFGGRAQDMRPEKRRRLAQRSRVALLQDPLAGAEAEILGSFALGKGLSAPQARDPAVQKVIDRAWADAINEQILTGYQAQRRLSNELLCSAELFITLYTGGGNVRVGRLDADRVLNPIADPENQNIPLWYPVVKRPAVQWDFQQDRAVPQSFVTPDGRQEVRYWAHWRNVADARNDRERLGIDPDEQPLPNPPRAKTARGVVYPVLINQTGDSLRGNPPWARSLRFFTAMNVLTEAHVTMAQAASTFIARRAMRGSARQITKAAQSVLSAAGELGASAFRPAAGWGIAGNAEPSTQPFTAPSTPGPFAPGSWWNENADSSTLSPLNLQSGSGQMAQTAQIVRAPIAASSQFGQHYLGDPTSANLATASTLELPATMKIQAWQEYLEQLLRWFTDRAIEEAVRAGELGGADALGDRPLSEMRLSEGEDRSAMEQRTGKDLTYEFSMPFPGRRQLPDVTTAVQSLCASMDPNGVNVRLRRILLTFFFEQIGIDGVARAVKECLPEEGIPGGVGPQSGGPSFAAASQKLAGAGGAQQPAGSPGEGQQPYGAKSGTATGGGSAGEDGPMSAALEGEWLPEGGRVAVDAMTAGAAKLFRELVLNPAVAGALALPSANGQH